MHPTDKPWTKPRALRIDVANLCEHAGEEAQRERLLRIRELVEQALELVENEGSPKSVARLRATIKAIDASLRAGEGPEAPHR